MKLEPEFRLLGKRNVIFFLNKKMLEVRYPYIYSFAAHLEILEY